MILDIPCGEGGLSHVETRPLSTTIFSVASLQHLRHLVSRKCDTSNHRKKMGMARIIQYIKMLYKIIVLASFMQYFPSIKGGLR